MSTRTPLVDCPIGTVGLFNGTYWHVVDIREHTWLPHRLIATVDYFVMSKGCWQRSNWISFDPRDIVRWSLDVLSDDDVSSLFPGIDPR